MPIPNNDFQVHDFTHIPCTWKLQRLSIAAFCHSSEKSFCSENGRAQEPVQQVGSACTSMAVTSPVFLWFLAGLERFLYIAMGGQRRGVPDHGITR
ncbi:MAG: hypothetical protein AABY77_05830, partial [Nitrospirota bacterium]